MPLHLNYRPADFGQFKGNKALRDKLRSIFEGRETDRPRAVLFHGPSGCGKTTLARILAAKVGCPPALETGPNPDFTEVNTANNRGIDTAREIMKQMFLRPLRSEARVWILDEVHQTSKDFQNSILKALEDTPKHVYFFLCTTEPEKLLPTIRNRCSQFEVKPLPASILEDLMREVMKGEGVDDFPESAVQEIAEVAEGCPRQALVILDQVIDLPDADLTRAIEAFRFEEREGIELCRLLANGSAWGGLRPVLEGLKKQQADPEKLRRAVMGYMAAILMKTENRQAAWCLSCFEAPLYNSGFPGLVLQCWNAVVNKDIPW
jgi:DNA polymerase-3 subunit gamma/tau